MREALRGRGGAEPARTAVAPAGAPRAHPSSASVATARPAGRARVVHGVPMRSARARPRSGPPDPEARAASRDSLRPIYDERGSLLGGFPRAESIPRSGGWGSGSAPPPRTRCGPKNRSRSPPIKPRSGRRRAEKATGGAAMPRPPRTRPRFGDEGWGSFRNRGTRREPRFWVSAESLSAQDVTFSKLCPHGRVSTSAASRTPMISRRPS